MTNIIDKMRNSNAPLIIIGAPRSGTNMLRDILTKLDGFETWPCDEINYIWRHGNKAYPSDEFVADMATEKIKHYLQNEFQRFARSSGASRVVEKTCANSLRVQFLEEVFPDAQYLFIVRDGVDAVASAMQRWHAELDLSYILKKARYVPTSDLPYYAFHYIYNRVYKLFSKEKRLSIWGPKLDGMSELLKNYSLEQICAIQWQRCVENSERDFQHIDQNRIFKLKYEDFVNDPVTKLSEVADFAGTQLEPEKAKQVTNFVSGASVGKGRLVLGSEITSKICTPISETLRRYGYGAH